MTPVMSLAATSRAPGASPRPVQHHYTGNKVDHLPRAQHKQIRARVTAPVPITVLGTTVKERARPKTGGERVKHENGEVLLGITIHSGVVWNDSEDSLTPRTQQETVKKEGGPIVGRGGSHGTGGVRIHPVKAEGLRGWATGQLLKTSDARWNVHGDGAATKEHLH